MTLKQFYGDYLRETLNPGNQLLEHEDEPEHEDDSAEKDRPTR